MEEPNSLMREQKPKNLIRDRWGSQELAMGEGEWPFENKGWTMIFYPYVHTKEDKIIWLEPVIEHTHAFVQQNVKMQQGVPLLNRYTHLYDYTEDLPYCLLCGVFMENTTWLYFQDCKEMV